MRWSLSNSISVMPGALELVTLKVTGPAGTLLASRAQPSWPPSLASVTLTVSTPLVVLVPLGADVLFAASVLEPQALTVSAAAAARAGTVHRTLRDSDLGAGR